MFLNTILDEKSNVYKKNQFIDLFDMKRKIQITYIIW